MALFDTVTQRHNHYDDWYWPPR